MIFSGRFWVNNRPFMQTFCNRDFKIISPDIDCNDFFTTFAPKVYLLKGDIEGFINSNLGLGL